MCSSGLMMMNLWQEPLDIDLSLIDTPTFASGE